MEGTGTVLRDAVLQRCRLKPGLQHWRSAFSLVELLVVIAVIVILMALLIPAIGMARAHARSKQCASNQVQIFTAWTRASDREPVRGPQWTTRLSTYVEGGEGVFFCPDDTTKSQPSSYAFNAHAWRFGGKDDGRITLLDYNQPEIKVVGQTLADLDANWPTQQAPRHFQSINVTFFDSHGDSYEPLKIDPRYCDYYIRYWRPLADSNIALAGCVDSGDPPPTYTFTPGTTTTGGTAGAATTSAGTTTTTGTTTATTTAGGTTTTTTTTTTTGGTTTGTTTGLGSTTSGTTTSTNPLCPAVPDLNAGLVRHFLFENAADLAEDETGDATTTYNPAAVTQAIDAERCNVGNFTPVSGPPFRVTNSALNGQNGWTCAWWWKVNASGGSTWALTGDQACSHSGFAMLFHAVSGSTMWNQNCFSRADTLPFAPPSGVWHHFAGSVNRTTGVHRAWLNGQPGVTDAPSGTNSFAFNALVVNGTYFPASGSAMVGLTGYFDDFRIYNRVLSDAEVCSLWRQGLPPAQLATAPPCP